jgi:hypothetical protein
LEYLGLDIRKTILFFIFAKQWDFKKKLIKGEHLESSHIQMPEKRL